MTTSSYWYTWQPKLLVGSISHKQYHCAWTEVGSSRSITFLVQWKIVFCLFRQFSYTVPHYQARGPGRLRYSHGQGIGWSHIKRWESSLSNPAIHNHRNVAADALSRFDQILQTEWSSFSINFCETLEMDIVTTRFNNPVLLCLQLLLP